MKLYFYILERPFMREPFIRFEECEVIEKPKTYYPVGKLPKGVYRSFIRKGEIGNFLDSNFKNVIVLDKNDSEKAMKLFEDCSKSEIERLYKSISTEKSILKAVEDYRKNG